MTQQQENQMPPTPPAKSGGGRRWIVVLVVVVIIIAAAVVVVEENHIHSSSVSPAVTISPTTTGSSSLVGTPIEFFTGIPNGAQYQKLVWNFGDGTTTTITSGVGTVSHTYAYPGIYLVSLTVYKNSTTVLTDNQSMIAITITPPIQPNPAAVFGPIVINYASPIVKGEININQTIPINGSINLSYGPSAPPMGSTVYQPSSNESTWYNVTSQVWSVDNGNKVIQNNSGTVNLTFTNPGLHTVSLTTTTKNATESVNGTYEITVAVGNYSVAALKTPSKSNILINAEYVPGGPRTFDPAVAYDTVSYEVLYEIYQPLVYYAGLSTNQFNPVIATEVPTVANGGITPNYLNYTFHINTSLQFYNGDHVTPYDVYISIARTLLFSDYSSNPGWILAHALLPAPTIYGPFNNSFYWIHHAITWNNATDTVTFHLLPDTPTWLPNVTATYAGVSYGNLNQSFPVQNYASSTIFLQFLAGPVSSYIMDYNWLKQYGGAPANNSASYAQFANTTNGPGIPAYYNQYIKENAMGTGPYYLSLYEPSQTVILKENPNYKQTPGMLPPNKLIPEIELQYLTNLGTAQQEIESGYAQFASGAFPPSDTTTALQYIQKGVLSSSTVAEMSVFFWAFNLDFNYTGLKSAGYSVNVPNYFFANLSVRQTIGYAFNYSYYINVANKQDNISFENQVSGILPPGIADYPSNISNTSPLIYSIQKAEAAWNQTNYSKTNQTYTFPIFNPTGSPVQDEMASVWEAAISQATNGHLKPYTEDINFNQEVTWSLAPMGQDPMPLYFLGWIDDYPAPADFVAPMLQPYGSYSWGDGLDPGMPYWNLTAGQYANVSTMWKDLVIANAAGNPANATLYYWKAETIAINLFFYVGTTQPVGPFYYSSSILPSSLTPTLNVAVGSSFIIYWALQYK